MKCLEQIVRTPRPAPVRLWISPDCLIDAGTLTTNTPSFVDLVRYHCEAVDRTHGFVIARGSACSFVDQMSMGCDAPERSIILVLMSYISLYSC